MTLEAAERAMDLYEERTSTFQISENFPDILHFDGAQIVRCKTLGDGACSIHSVFGRHTNAGYCCPHARELVLQAMGDVWEELPQRCDDMELIQELRDCIWNDFVVKAVTSREELTTEANIVWIEICKSFSLKEICLCAVHQDMIQLKFLNDLRAELVNMFTPLCKAECEHTILQPMLSHMDMLHEFCEPVLTGNEGYTKLSRMYIHDAEGNKLKKSVLEHYGVDNFVVLHDFIATRLDTGEHREYVVELMALQAKLLETHRVSQNRSKCKLE